MYQKVVIGNVRQVDTRSQTYLEDILFLKCCFIFFLSLLYQLQIPSYRWFQGSSLAQAFGSQM